MMTSILIDAHTGQGEGGIKSLTPFAFQDCRLKAIFARHK
jgi:hypothetical protein